MKDIREKDWKLARGLKEKALEMACEKILDKIEETTKNSGKNNHSKYLEIWKILKVQDKDIALMFNDFKRSTAIQKVSFWRYHNLISDVDFSDFTVETQKEINRMVDYLKEDD